MKSPTAPFPASKAVAAWPRRGRRGFTMVELMVVVTIVGILAAIGITLFRNHVFNSKSTEALAMIQSIRAAQERFRAETLRYFNVSDSLDAYYPAAPNRDRRLWENRAHGDYNNWRLLNPTEYGQVMCGYATVAGTAGQDPDVEAAVLPFREPPNLRVPSEPWYLIHAAADPQGDGKKQLFMAGSFTAEVYEEEEEAVPP